MNSSSPSVPEALVFEEFRAFEVVVPVRAEVLVSPPGSRAHAESATWPEQSITLIEARTNTGITAVGEAPRGTSRETIEAALREWDGRDLRTWHPLQPELSMFGEQGMRSLYPIRSHQGRFAPLGGLFEALWLDAVGQQSGLPAHAFLGGKVRDHVTVDAWANRPNAEQLATLIGQAVADGFHGIKLKCGPDGDTLRALTETRSDWPENFSFTVDAMNALRTLREATPWLDGLNAVVPRITLEDPFAFSRLDDWRQCRDRWNFPVVLHARTLAHLQQAIASDQASAYNLGGSPWQFLHLANYAETHSADCWQGSGLELGIIQTLRLHTAACARSCVLPSDLQSFWVREHLLTDQAWHLEPDGLRVPDRPGLGCALNHTVLPRYVQNEWALNFS